VRISKAFSEFESTPLAAASLGQVHRARLRDGRPVAVKVQRPGIREQIAEDLEAFAALAEFLDAHSEMGKRYEFEKMLDEFRATLTSELDYRQEARNLVTIGRNLENSLSSSSRSRSWITRPNPGNVFVTDDGRVALLDLGMVARLQGSMQDALLKLLLAVAEGQGDEAAERRSKSARSWRPSIRSSFAARSATSSAPTSTRRSRSFKLEKSFWSSRAWRERRACVFPRSWHCSARRS
jgi:predicted unusual protein kinase regulating ubiquinone biosynthesis (AarF/ABC1/UbiB family)